MIYSSIGKAQTLSDQANGSLLVVDTLGHTKPVTPSDLMLRVRDALEISLLLTSQTYVHIERLLASFSPHSKQLDLLPSVMPVDLPIQAFRISSPFGFRRHPIHQQTRFHRGVDVKVATGMLLKATAPGVVCQVGYDPNLGAFVRIEHAFGFETTYGHLSGYCVRPGQQVSRNEEVGRVGQSGLATGPHLHYTIKKNGSAIDPFQFCFLLRRRLWFYAEKSKTSGLLASKPVNCLSPKGE